MCHFALGPVELRCHELVWEVPTFTQTLTCVCSVYLHVIVWMLVCANLTDVLCPNLSLWMLARSPSPQIVEYRFPASLLEGEEGWRWWWCWWWLWWVGVAEVTADLLAACFAKESLFPRNGETNTHNARTNKHMSSPHCLNTVHTYCKSPPAFGYSLMYTYAPTDTHKHKHVNNTHRECYTDMTNCCVKRDLSPPWLFDHVAFPAPLSPASPTELHTR